MTDKRKFSPGWGDGEAAFVAPGVYAVEVNYNGVHPHLPGDFIKRSKDGDHILMTKDNFDNLQEAAKWFLSYWKSCKPWEHDLDDYQISEITRRMEGLRNMVGVKE